MAGLTTRLLGSAAAAENEQLISSVKVDRRALPRTPGRSFASVRTVSGNRNNLGTTGRIVLDHQIRERARRISNSDRTALTRRKALRTSSSHRRASGDRYLDLR